MRVTRLLGNDDPVVGIFGRILRIGDSERRTDLHALEDEVHAEPFGSLHLSEARQNVVLLAHALLRPFDRNPVIAGEGINPPDVVVGPLTQDLLGNRADLMNVAEEVDDVLRTREQRKVTKNDDAIETVVYERDEAAEQLRKGVHRSSPIRSFLAERSSCGGPRHSIPRCPSRARARSLTLKFQISLGSLRNGARSVTWFFVRRQQVTANCPQEARGEAERRRLGGWHGGVPPPSKARRSRARRRGRRRSEARRQCRVRVRPIGLGFDIVIADV